MRLALLHFSFALKIHGFIINEIIMKIKILSLFPMLIYSTKSDTTLSLNFYSQYIFAYSSIILHFYVYTKGFKKVLYNCTSYNL